MKPTREMRLCLGLDPLILQLFAAQLLILILPDVRRTCAAFDGSVQLGGLDRTLDGHSYLPAPIDRVKRGADTSEARVTSTKSPSSHASTSSKPGRKKSHAASSSKPHAATVSSTVKPGEAPKTSKPKSKTKRRKKKNKQQVSTTTSPSAAHVSTTPKSSLPAEPSSSSTKAPDVEVANSSSSSGSKGKGTTLSPVVKEALTKSPESEGKNGDSSQAHFDARDVTFYLESHPAREVHDPRAYLTDERTSKSLAVMLHELNTVPERIRLAFVVRAFNEFGRKMASKLNKFAAELTPIIRRAPDALGNKPEVGVLVDAAEFAFDSTLDADAHTQPGGGDLNHDVTSSGGDIDGEYDEAQSDKIIEKLIKEDTEKLKLYNGALDKISDKYARLLAYFVQSCTNPSESLVKIESGEQFAKFVQVLNDAMAKGSADFIKSSFSSDKYRVTSDMITFSGKMFDKIADSLTNNYLSVFKNESVSGSSSSKHRELNGDGFMDLGSFANKYNDEGAREYSQLSQLSDKHGLEGPWSNNLFVNMGNAERAIKFFASLLLRVPNESRARWLRMYQSQLISEIEHGISGFINMQSSPYVSDNSVVYLLQPKEARKIVPQKSADEQRSTRAYNGDKQRIPARCYLAGRRWRLVLSRALKGYKNRDKVIKSIADRVATIKRQVLMQSGTGENYRMCLPRLEAGLQSLSIDGEPQVSEVRGFLRHDPVDGVGKLTDPFASGAQLGYSLGFKLGYNEQRNTTLELERAGGGPTPQMKAGSATVPNRDNSTRIRDMQSLRKLVDSCMRHASAVAAESTFPVALHEGYMTTLRVGLQAGLMLLSDLGAAAARLRCKMQGQEVGASAARSMASAFVDTSGQGELTRKLIIALAERQGRIAGGEIGETVGTIVGEEAAAEAYKRSIERAGLMTQIRFYIEQYKQAARLAFEFGFDEGRRVAASSQLDPSAPRFMRLPGSSYERKYSRRSYQQEHDEGDADHWENELMPPLTDAKISALHGKANHTLVEGTLEGEYAARLETKHADLKRVSFVTETRKLEFAAKGFIDHENNVVYLSINGTANNQGVLQGFVIADSNRVVEQSSH